MKETPYKTLFIFADQAAFDNRAPEHQKVNGISPELWESLKILSNWERAELLGYYDREDDREDYNVGCWNCLGCRECHDCSFCKGAYQCTNCIGIWNRADMFDETMDQHHPDFNIDSPDPSIMCQIHIPNVFREIWKEVQDKGLDMSLWHGTIYERAVERWECDTTHCWAGWAVHLGGESAYKCEDKHSTATIAMNIFRRAVPGIPIYYADFYMPDEYAKFRIKQCAEMEASLTDQTMPKQPGFYSRLLSKIRNIYG